MLQRTGYPDVICMQEVRLKSSAQSRSMPQEKELKGDVEQVLHTVFKDYTKLFWSLADTRYSGTLTLVHKRVDFHGESAFTPDSSICALACRYNTSRKDAGLPELKELRKKSGSAKASKQASMTSFFKPAAPKKAAPSPISKKQAHTVEGRFQFFSFANMDLVQTYVPNNGLKHESIQRRREWDESMMQFFEQRMKLLKHVGDEDRPILWCGDLNCALTPLDGSHWKKTETGELVEYWTDESQSLTTSSKRDENRHVHDMGIPSFTVNERKRLHRIMETASLTDVWRLLFPKGDCRYVGTNQWAAPNYTWRGHIGKTGSFQSKYEGKGQRLDYFLLATHWTKYVTKCEILGSETQRIGFCGSDHCPTILVLESPC